MLSILFISIIIFVLCVYGNTFIENYQVSLAPIFQRVCFSSTSCSTKDTNERKSSRNESYHITHNTKRWKRGSGYGWNRRMKGLEWEVGSTRFILYITNFITPFCSLTWLIWFLFEGLPFNTMSVDTIRN